MIIIVGQMEGVMLVDGLERAADALVAGWRSCIGEEITVSTLSYLVVI